eukprot:TRINITY_DN2725_c0_g3_i1.p1 TRINITY_DN2725_c0_g3~~TRINITY_DN2725_c0_g3_i1.p1  ORF type:complete len:561 (+),score=130.66 TRINITY_DN2725_c0_g3_i1:51-1733(+)
MSLRSHRPIFAAMALSLAIVFALTTNASAHPHFHHGGHNHFHAHDDHSHDDHFHNNNNNNNVHGKAPFSAKMIPNLAVKSIQRAFRIADSNSKALAPKTPEEMFAMLQEPACLPKCPVCQMSVSSASNRLVVGDNQYVYFCSAGCRDEAHANSAKYLASTNTLPIAECFHTQEHNCPICNMDVVVGNNTKHIEWNGGQKSFVCDMMVDHSITLRNDIASHVQQLPETCKQAKCPVCQMTVDPLSTTNAVKFANGQHVTACSKGCQEKILKDPEAYLDAAADASALPACDDGKSVACPACNDRFLARSTTPSLIFVGGQRLYSCMKSDGTTDASMIKGNMQKYITTPIPPVDDDDDDDQGGSNPPAGGRCPVCGMDLPDNPAYQNLNHGQVIYFCSSGCKDTFVADPNSYFGTSGSGSGGHSMAMFFVNTMEAIILFEGWETKTSGEYVLAMFAIFAICLFHEYLAAFRHTFYAKLKSQPKSKSGDMTNEPIYIKHGRAIVALMYMISSMISLAIMLIAMTYNTGLFFTIIVGMGTGWYLFGYERGPSTSDTCCADYDVLN